jgi:hypothetical protein
MKAKVEAASPARITQQFREQTNMTYELDCAGTTLVLRVYFPTEAGEWRIAAHTSSAESAPSADSTAPSRREALRALASSCRDGGEPAEFARVDWGAVEQAMAQVRAI